MSERLVCTSCDKSKAELRSINSRLIAGMKINMCKDCIGKKYEPRFIVILAANQFPTNDKVIEYIKKKLYLGDEIPARDIV